MNNDIVIQRMKHLVLSFVPPPHVAEQEVHDPQSPTSQSTEYKVIKQFVYLYYQIFTRELTSHVAVDGFCNFNDPRFCAFQAIANGIRYLVPAKMKNHILVETFSLLVRFCFPIPQVPGGK